MTTDYRALCAELLAAADEYAGMNPYMRLDNAMKAARAALAAEPKPPVEGEVAELVEWLRNEANQHAVSWPEASSKATRLADFVERLAPQPAPEAVSDALIKAECALSDIAEGEPELNSDSADLLKWSEQRCAETLAIIRPVMTQYKIRTSEWLPAPRPVLEGPSTDELHQVFLDHSGYIGAARAVLARWGTPNLARVRSSLGDGSAVPEEPTDEELTLTYAYAVAAAMDSQRGPFENEDALAAQLAGFRAVLARWGHTPNA